MVTPSCCGLKTGDLDEGGRGSGRQPGCAQSNHDRGIVMSDYGEYAFGHFYR